MNRLAGQVNGSAGRARGTPAQHGGGPRRARFAKSLAAVTTAGVIMVSGYGATAASASTVNITWETMWSGPTLQLLAQMIKAFESTHPGITVTESNIPSATGDAKLQSQITAGDPPDIFTEWNPVLGEYAANGLIQSMNPYLSGPYASFEKWEYPIALDGGLYKGKLYAIPMSMNSWALYYNKSIMKAAGITSPPTTLAQLYADQAKEWVIKNGKLQQIGFYPGGGFQYFASFFGAVNCFNSAGKYDFENCAGAKAEANFILQYDNYPYAQVNSLEAAYGSVAGGDDDAFVAGKEGFNMDGPWEGAQNVPDANPKMEGNFGVVPFPGTVGGPSTFGQGNYNIIPKGASDPKAAFEFITWLAGFNNLAFNSSMDPKGGWMPVSPQVAAAPAYRTWVKANPWLNIYIEQMSSKYSVTPALTPTESQFQQAEQTATDNILEKTMKPAQALKYIDTQANG
jgi:multiple sugar transport system substrate-binding protein